MFNSSIKGEFLDQWNKAGPFNLYEMVDSKKISFDDTLQIDVKDITG